MHPPKSGRNAFRYPVPGVPVQSACFFIRHFSPSTCRDHPSPRTVLARASQAMSHVESDWVEAVVQTSTMCKVVWQVYIEMRNGSEVWADFGAPDNHRIDASYSTDKLPVTLGQRDASWTIDLQQMVQRNDQTSTERRIRRIVIVANPRTTD